MMKMCEWFWAIVFYPFFVFFNLLAEGLEWIQKRIHWLLWKALHLCHLPLARRIEDFLKSEAGQRMMQENQLIHYEVRPAIDLFPHLFYWRADPYVYVTFFAHQEEWDRRKEELKGENQPLLYELWEDKLKEQIKKHLAIPDEAFDVEVFPQSLLEKEKEVKENVERRKNG